MVEFCEKCGNMLLPSKDENGNKILKCRCGWTKIADEIQEEQYKVKTTIEHSVREELSSTSEILKWKDENLKSAIKNFKCKRCGYDKAGIETRQTRSADEGMTHFIVCLRCGSMRKIGS
jgi:DNA-directed RNA polymerase subunit M/transcription elongation factor TFIIS